MSSSIVADVTPELLARYEPVIGLEVHVQLATRTKLFCACPTGFGAAPNTNVCPVCLGLPGPLPVLNRAAVQMAMKAGMALNARDRAVVRRLVGIEIDLKNLDWISRFRNYYKLPFAEIRDLLLPNGSKIGAEALADFAAEGRMSDAAARVARGTGILLPESDIFPREQSRPADRDAIFGASQLDAMERFLSHILLSEARRAFRGNPLCIGSILGYFYCLRMETRNLKTLLTGKRYGIPAPQIESYLVV